MLDMWCELQNRQGHGCCLHPAAIAALQAEPSLECTAHVRSVTNTGPL